MSNMFKFIDFFLGFTLFCFYPICYSLHSLVSFFAHAFVLRCYVLSHRTANEYIAVCSATTNMKRPEFATSISHESSCLSSSSQPRLTVCLFLQGFRNRRHASYPSFRATHVHAVIFSMNTLSADAPAGVHIVRPQVVPQEENFCS
jgi:hypothetical protein